MKRRRISVPLITSASVAAMFAGPGTVKTTRAQLSTGKAPVESIPPHGYVIASKPLKGTDTPADYTFVLTRDEIYVPVIVRKPKGDGPFMEIRSPTGYVNDCFGRSQTVASVEERVIDIVCENLGVNKEQVTRQTSFQEDVGADSLDIVELVMELEEEFEITIPDDQAEKIKTVGEAIDYIEKEQGKK